MILEAKNISKNFGGVKALTQVNLLLHPGKVNAIIGENGAGKSTLMKILSGVHTQYEGELLLDNKKVKFSGTRQAEAAGIAIIHQELNLVPYLSIAENLFLGREITNAIGMVDNRQMKQKTREILDSLDFQTDPSTKISDIRVGEQQLVEIAKALLANASVIIMDEPTSAISDKEVATLFKVIARLKSEGKTIVYISHKFKELFEIADHYIVLRDGATVSAGEMPGIDEEQLIRLMSGRDITRNKRQANPAVGVEVLSVQNLTLKHPSKRSVNLLNNISFDLRKGEVLGCYGLMGAGRTELMETIFGLHVNNSTGKILVEGKLCSMKTSCDAIKCGIALVPEDRKMQGLILDQSISKNISLPVLTKIEQWGLVLNEKREKNLAEDYMQLLSIKAASRTSVAETLSGGNQQKIVIAKWLASRPKILLLDEPTRGIDVKAKAEIYKLIQKLAAEGMGIIVVSSELPEIMAVSDRVLVLCEGNLTANQPIHELTEQSILAHALPNN